MRVFKRRGCYWLTDGSPPNRIRATIHQLYRRHTGRRILPVASKGEAQRYAVEIFNLIHSSTGVAAVPLDRAVLEFLDHCRAIGLKDSTVRSHVGLLREFRRTSAIVTLADMTAQRIQKALDSLPVKNRTRNRYLSSVRRFCGYCRQVGYLQFNPAAEIPRYREIDPRIARFISGADFETMLAETDRQFAALLKIAYYTGRRRGDLWWLWSTEWQSVDLELGLMIFPLGVTKLSTPERVPISRETVKAICSLTNVPAYSRPDAITRRFKRLMHRLGMPYRFHDFRATAETRLRESGYGDTEIMALLGRRSPIVGQTIYTVHQIKYLRTAAESISV